MKKTTNSNPLKYFNDAASARAKSVNAGNNKLRKAQMGEQTKYSDGSDKYTYNSTGTIRTGKNPNPREAKMNEMMRKDYEAKHNPPPVTPPVVQDLTPYKPYPSLEKEMNKRKSLGNPYKKGGAVKSKKK
jgi:hypothetical protein